MLKGILATDVNNGIGLNGKIPWSIKEEQEYFARRTKGSVVVMGRKTAESLHNKPLKGRVNIVLTKNKDWSVPGFRVIHEATEEAIVEVLDDDMLDLERWIIGGAEVYYAFSEQIKYWSWSVIYEDYGTDTKYHHQYRQGVLTASFQVFDSPEWTLYELYDYTKKDAKKKVEELFEFKNRTLLKLHDKGKPVELFTKGTDATIDKVDDEHFSLVISAYLADYLGKVIRSNIMDNKPLTDDDKRLYYKLEHLCISRAGSKMFKSLKETFNSFMVPVSLTSFNPLLDDVIKISGIDIHYLIHSSEYHTNNDIITAIEKNLNDESLRFMGDSPNARAMKNDCISKGALVFLCSNVKNGILPYLVNYTSDTQLLLSPNCAMSSLRKKYH